MFYFMLYILKYGYFIFIGNNKSTSQKTVKVSDCNHIKKKYVHAFNYIKLVSVNIVKVDFLLAR